MTQAVIVAVIVAGAVLFLGLRAYKAWSGKKQKGCEKCGTISPQSSKEIRTSNSRERSKVN